MIGALALATACGFSGAQQEIDFESIAQARPGSWVVIAGHVVATHRDGRIGRFLLAREPYNPEEDLGTRPDRTNCVRITWRAGTDPGPPAAMEDLEVSGRLRKSPQDTGLREAVERAKAWTSYEFTIETSTGGIPGIVGG